MSDDINMQEVADFLNTQARQGRILAKAEEVAKAVMQADARIKEADNAVVAAKKEAARVMGEAETKVDSAKARLEALGKQIAEAEAKIPQAGEQAARIVAKANEEAAKVTASAEAQAASVMAGAQSQRTAHEQAESQFRARALTAQNECLALEKQRDDIAATIAALKKQAKALAGV